ncbi:hypothetical protein P170DRAFT_35161 [Aspergillus steynii IBT 23096]|uniref:Uncharacterized protein n=1 Tax=Aspergillus steynii IBT 23096 TaxID=1392250 RepID=A0A2I2GQN1_9EURO|nr:uncharacterized protein P170DRAFT_35161 [Aspergillus steynii IBT 23096]PLB55187.1 hypothetical protein P170DRAFT_35161 [Aspergillus steynii IBT 23096]
MAGRFILFTVSLSCCTYLCTIALWSPPWANFPPFVFFPLISFGWMEVPRPQIWLYCEPVISEAKTDQST